MELRSAPRLLVLTAIVAGLSGVTACGPATTTTASPATSAPTVADSSPPPTLPSAEPSGPTGSGGGSGTVTGTGTVTGIGVCKASAMAEAGYGGDGAAGTGYSGLVLTNKASTSCKVPGYPVVSFVDASGKAYKFPVHYNHGSASTLTVAPGGKVYFIVGLGLGPMNDDQKQAPCDPAAAGMRISFSTDGSDALTDKGAWRACGAADVTPFTTKPDPNMHH
jgi:hypothetical protein